MCAVTDDDLVLTVSELSKALRVARRSAYVLVASGQIRSVRVGPAGRGIRIPRSALEEFLAGENGSQETKLSDFDRDGGE
jgi:excisionase family DNA binding protein